MSLDEDRCTKCGHVWPLAFFFVTRAGETSRSSRCARCRRLGRGESFDSAQALRTIEAFVR